MSKLFSAIEICEEALGAIGAFPVTETAPDGQVLRRAMTWLDMILSQNSAVTRMFSRIDATLAMLITNGTGSYDFYVTLGTQLPEDRIQYIVDAWVDDGNSNRYPVEIVNQRKFEDVCRTNETGRPCWLTIDREMIDPTLRIYPVPDVTDTTVWTLKLIVQQRSPSVAPAGVSGTQPLSSFMHMLGDGWQRWLVAQLSHDLGSGPIHKLPEASLNRFGAMAKDAKADLLAFENRTHETTPPIGESAFGGFE